jgi:hypothetical protein
MLVVAGVWSIVISSTRERVKVELFNVDDKEVVYVNGRERASVPFPNSRDVDLGWLADDACVTVEALNGDSGYAWGIRLKSGGRTIGPFRAGNQGFRGANGNDDSHTGQVVFTITIQASGRIVDLRRVMRRGQPPLKDLKPLLFGGCAHRGPGA